MSEEQMRKKLNTALSVMREELTGSRDLKYPEDSIGITALLGCPLKQKYKKQFPDIPRNTALAIDDGFMFEQMMENGITEAFSDAIRVEHDMDLFLNLFNKLKVTGHPDFVAEYEDKVINMEFKCPVFAHHHLEFEPFFELPEDEVIWDDKNLFVVNDSYVLQARVQNKMCEMYFNKPVEGYLVMKQIFRFNNKYKKALVIKPVNEPMTDDELLEIVNKYLYERKPRYGYECYFCSYKRPGMCKGRYTPRDIKTRGITNEQKKVLNRLHNARQETSLAEETLKKMIEGSVVYKGREVGWVQKQKNLTLRRAHQSLGSKVFDYLQIDPKKEEELMQIVEEKDPDKITCPKGAKWVI